MSDFLNPLTAKAHQVNVTPRVLIILFEMDKNMLAKRRNPSAYFEKYISTGRLDIAEHASAYVDSNMPQADESPIPTSAFFDDDYQISHPFSGFVAFME
jgi:hypothetical protein